MNQSDIKRKPHRFIGFTNPEMAADGRSIAILAQTESGKTLDLEIPFKEIGSIIDFLVLCASSATEPVNGSDSYSPIPIHGLGLATGRTADETLLVVRLAGCELAFSLASKQIAALGHDFAQIAQVLVASGRPQ